MSEEIKIGADIQGDGGVDMSGMSKAQKKKHKDKGWAHSSYQLVPYSS